MKNDGFGGEVKWKFPEGTTFEKGHWYRKVLLKEHEKMKEEKKLKSSCKRMEISQNPWKRKVDLIEISSDDESEDDSWDGIFMTNRDMQASKRRRKVPTKIIKDMNKMTAQHERVLDKMSKVENLRMDQDLFLKWETVKMVERKKVTETTEESKGVKTVTRTVQVRLDKIKTKTYEKLNDL